MSTLPIYIVSGGTGASGEQIVRTALAQFPDPAVSLTIVPHVREVAALEDVVRQAAASGGLVVHTLVDAALRHELIRLAREENVVAVDLMGHLLSRLTAALGQEPLGQPGLYRQLRESYFERVEAMEFAVTHDDGRNPHELDQADIVLAGVSRTGKTPLSMYLAMRGWKVANVPLIRGIQPPPQLFEVERDRVVGLTIDAGQLAEHRRWRQRRLGLDQGSGPYVDLAEIHEEIRAAQEVFRRGGFRVLDITNQPIEESADAIIGMIRRGNPAN